VAKRERYDVVIVGAGALGLASAYHLNSAHPELSVLVVDAQSGPGEGSMGASAAMVRDVFSSPDNQLLAHSAIRFYRHLMDEHEELREPAPLLDLYGYLWLLPESRRREYYAIVEESGGTLDVEKLDLDGVRTCPGVEVAPDRWFEGDRAEPPEPITGGLFGRNCGAVAPELLAQFYFNEAQRHGVEFQFGTVAQRLSFEGRDEILLHDRSQMPFAFQRAMRGRLRISRVSFAGGGSVHADTVVVAAGAWSQKLLHPLGVATACSPRIEQLFAISGPPVEELLRWQPPVHPIDTDRGRSRFPFLILPSGAVLKPIFPQKHIWVELEDTVAHPIGTREDPVAAGRLDYNMAQLGDRDAFATDVLPAVTPYLPRLESADVHLENSWGGYYNFSPEGLPVLVEEAFGVIFVGGDSGSGVMKADSLGRLVTAKYDQRTEARLYSGASYHLDRLSLAHRVAQEERIIL
jgi:glycine/D-amino acid oxidase-like deaminating enzyme